MKLTADGKIDSVFCLGADEKKHAVLNPDSLLGQCMETAVHASRSYLALWEWGEVWEESF